MGKLRARRPRPGMGGFSIVEAMVAAGILGIALVGLVRLHTTSLEGTVRSSRVGRAAEVARQLAETVAAQPFNQLPACGPGPGAPLAPAPAGCRGTVGASTIFSMPGVNGNCTTFVDGADVQDVSLVGVAAPPPNARFRVDAAVSQHPDPPNYPNTALLTIWVCWTERKGEVREIATTRMVSL